MRTTTVAPTLSLQEVSPHGWSNTETWMTALTIRRDTALYTYLLSLKHKHFELQAKIAELKAMMFELVEEDYNDRDSIERLKADLRITALSRVNWVEIIKRYL
jgi:hypothetical protein